MFIEVSTRSSRSGLDKSCLLQAVAMLQGEFDDRDIPAAYEFVSPIVTFL